MQTVRDLEALRASISCWRAAGEKIALVPTMGALHAGHLALVEDAKRRADRVVVSIFVNPLQFNDQGDLARYPRTEEADAAKLEAAGVDIAWMPLVADLYPEGFATRIGVDGVAERWEGAHRPGHFDGVATVVAKLLIAVAPDVAIFGEKDYQQLAVVRRMAVDLGLPVEIVGHETVREADGLAMSSRNLLLSPDERQRAPALAATLRDLAAAIIDGAAPAVEIAQAIARLENEGFGPIDYAAYVDGATFEPLKTYRTGGRLIVAAFLGKVRLIDNICVERATG